MLQYGGKLILIDIWSEVSTDMHRYKYSNSGGITSQMQITKLGAIKTIKLAIVYTSNLVTK